MDNPIIFPPFPIIFPWIISPENHGKWWETIGKIGWNLWWEINGKSHLDVHWFPKKKTGKIRRLGQKLTKKSDRSDELNLRTFRYWGKITWLLVGTPTPKIMEFKSVAQWIECLELFLTFNDVRNICYIAPRIAWEATFIYDFCLVPIYGFPPLSQLTNPNSKSSFSPLFGFRR